MSIWNILFNTLIFIWKIMKISRYYLKLLHTPDNYFNLSDLCRGATRTSLNGRLTKYNYD